MGHQDFSPEFTTGSSYSSIKGYLRCFLCVRRVFVEISIDSVFFALHSLHALSAVALRHNQSRSLAYRAEFQQLLGHRLVGGLQHVDETSDC